MRKLKVIPINHPDIDAVIKKYKLSKTDELCSAGMYLHGLLEEDTGHDMFVILNIGKMPTCSAEDKDEPKLRYIDYEGRLDVEVYGNPKPCVGYVWKPLKNSNLRKGLIVYADDTTYREHALKCYKEKRFII